MKNTFALIMAGGEGIRFAPLSTPERPKQFLNFLGEGSFLQQTKWRVETFLPNERIYVATNTCYVSLVREQLSELPFENIIAEPIRKNTAPCLAYVAQLLLLRDPRTIMIVLPSDHIIKQEKIFYDVLDCAVKHAREKERLVTLGIKPKWPSADYGYMRAKGEEKNVCEVDAFVEKPNETLARQYIDAGNWYWNSGIFVWQVNVFLRELRKHFLELSSLLDGFTLSNDYRKNFFSNAPNISVDYAILEHSTFIDVIPASFGWSDVGTWEGLYDLHRSNVVQLSAEVVDVMKQILRGEKSEEIPY